MLVLLSQDWPWVVIGGLLCLWGIRLVGLPVRAWLSFILSLPFIFFSDDTQSEKELRQQPSNEIIVANPGCFILMFGLALLVLGIIKLLT